MFMDSSLYEVTWVCKEVSGPVTESHSDHESEVCTRRTRVSWTCPCPRPQESTLHLVLRLRGGAKKRKKKSYTTPKKNKHKRKKVKLAVLKYYKVRTVWTADLQLRLNVLFPRTERRVELTAVWTVCRSTRTEKSTGWGASVPLMSVALASSWQATLTAITAGSAASPTASTSLRTSRVTERR